ncbi:hypothetical protein BV22DRAFT_1023020, partial [Leucogyrophana mollusca]
MCLYEFIGRTKKVQRKHLEFLPRIIVTESDEEVGDNPEETSGLFCDAKHPQFETHRLKLRETFIVPVLLGDSIPRYDRSDAEREEWARAVLILFKPWRVAADLRREGISWFDSFESCRSSFPSYIWSTIKNINVLAECRDARAS